MSERQLGRGALLTANLAAGVGDALGRPVRYVPLDPEDFGRLLAPMLGEQAAAAADYRFLAQRPRLLDLDADTTPARRALAVPHPGRRLGSRPALGSRRRTRLRGLTGVRTMTHDERRAFLSAGRRTATLATVRADGSPHVVPIGFVLDGDD